ncbi:MAG: hypothetical protein JWM74_4077, partial [Myxococcaceae bacterium]|nr:hypothetical protein [Myxococcaceae bacterium]
MTAFGVRVAAPRDGAHEMGDGYAEPRRRQLESSALKLSKALAPEAHAATRLVAKAFSIDTESA